MCVENAVLNFPGHRYRTFFDLGQVALGILQLVPEDSGQYLVR